MTQDLKFGRKPPKNAPALRLSSFLTGTVPSAPSAEDYGQLFTGWQMLGNDQYGDCVAVTWANQRALVTTVLAGKTSYPNQDQVFTFYKTQNPSFPSEDKGMDVQTALEDLHSKGGPDGVKAVAFAKVDYTNEDELRAAHAIFGQVWYGVNVLDANMTEFNEGQAWDYVKNSAVDGGHSITGVGYDPSSYKFVTWATETEWTEAFRQHQVEEAWVVIWPEHLGTTEFQQGVDLAALAAAYQEITGNVLPIPPAPTPVPPTPVPTPTPPTPTPTPTPVPTPPVPTPVPVPPVPDDADAELWAVGKGWSQQFHWFRSNKKMATALQDWARKKGLPTS